MRLALVAVLAAATLGSAPNLSAAPAAAASGPHQYSPIIGRRVIGYSVEHRPIVAYHLGNPRIRRVSLILGQMHGDERAGVSVVRSILHGHRAVRGVNLWVIPTMNPDGYRAHTRQNAHGVDLNRNWPVKWAPLKGQYYAGPKALSEPETRAMYRFLRRLRPHWFVSMHQPLDGVDTTDGGRVDPAFRRRLASGLGLPQKPLRCWSTCHGNMTRWYTARHYANHRFGAGITVEFGSGPSKAYLTERARRAVVHAFGGHFGPRR